MLRLPEKDFVVGKAKKRSVDWIVAHDAATLFLKCKSKRLSWGAKASLTDLKPLKPDIDSMAAAIVQLYKTIGLSRRCLSAFPC